MLRCGLTPRKTLTPKDVQILRNIFGQKCHELFSSVPALAVLVFCMFSGNLDAQMTFPARPPRVNAPARDEVRVSAILQEMEGPLSKLRGRAHVETTEMMIEADEIDYNQNTHYAEARGNVKFDHFERGEHIEADRV